MMPSVTSRFKKNLSRTKEKILQGMGKNDRTSDENFDLYVENFELQQAQVSKLSKELNKYLNCLKETQKSSKTFYETLKETFEPTWPDSNLFAEKIQLMEIKWMDYMNKLVNEVQSPLIAYLNEFPELKKKIEKRENRLLDFDNARHALESIKHKASKKNSFSVNGNSLSGEAVNRYPSSSESTTSNNNNINSSNVKTTINSLQTDQLTKLTKLKIDLEDKQSIYEEINQTLCMTLPVLYENRIKFYSSLFQSFFHTETIFHSDCVEVKSKLDDICENLSTKTILEKKKNLETDTVKSNERLDFKTDGNYNMHKFQLANSNLKNSYNQENFSDKDEKILKNCEVDNDNQVKISNKIDNNPSFESHLFLYKNSLKYESNKNNHSNEILNLELSENQDSKEIIDLSAYKYKKNQTKLNDNEIETEENYSFINSKIKYLYKVKATYAYDAKEIDELTFAKDDIIDVVDGSQSEKEELDDGWLIGIHENTLKRGLFPENFTKKYNFVE